MFGNEIQQNPAQDFSCTFCDFNTSKKCNYDSHILTAKHKMAMVGNENGNEIQQKLGSKYICKYCSKSYKDNSGLWKHRNNSKCANKNNIITNVNDDNNKNDALVEYLMKENKEIKQMIIELAKKESYNNCHNTNTTNNHTNSHNKAFNLNFFLNETCKEAMNIGEFVDSLKIQLSDLENIGEAGYIEGISNIIVKNLKELDITKRPVHCTDKKRETIYIKDADKWEKDENKTQMHKLIKRVVSKNTKMFAKFKEVHPDCLTYHSKFSEQYNKIIYESMGGKGDDDYEKNEKIIKNVLKEVVVDKNL
jgi:hypothetical protein